MISKILLYFTYLYPLGLSWRLNKYRNLIYSLWMKRYIKNSNSSCEIQRGVTIIGGKFIQIGDNTSIWRNCRIEAVQQYENQLLTPELTIGSNCSIGENSHITCANKIIIGDGFLTGRRVLISDNNHGEFSYEDLQIPPLKRKVISKGPIIIEDNVWLGEGSSVLGNVKIGKGSIVAANAVVTKDVPPYSLVAGVPAKIIKCLES